MEDALLIAVTLLFCAVAAIFGVVIFDSHEIEAIERGYALHCPVDGRFAWVDPKTGKGECE